MKPKVINFLKSYRKLDKMEQSEHFNGVITFIKELEQQLLKCNDTLQTIERAGEEATKEIEEHFAKCLSLLAARKAMLLSEVESKLNGQKIQLMDVKTKLEKSVEGCKEILKTGSSLYSSSKGVAENIWKEAKHLPNPQVSVGIVTANLPDLFENIQSYGTVSITTKHRSNTNVDEISNALKAEMVTTFAGSGAAFADGNGANINFNYLCGICLNPSDKCLYICDFGNNAIRKLTMQGEVTTFVPSGKNITSPSGIAVNHKDNIFFVTCQRNHTINKVTSLGVVSVFAGSGKAEWTDGIGTNASFNSPNAIAVDQKTGNLYVTDYKNHMVRVITPQGKVSTLAGSQEAGYADGIGKAAKFNYPWGIVFDESDQSLLVCDRVNNKLRRVSLTGVVSTICDIPCPSFITIANTNVIFVSSYDDNTIMQVIKQGTGNYAVEVLAGGGERESVDGKPHACCFKAPMGIAYCETSRACFVADSWGNKIRKITFRE